MSSFPLCDEHVTVLAFTGKTWCGICKGVEPEFVKLHEEVSRVNDFHFVQLDDSEPGVVEWNKRFAVRGVPTILIYDPLTKALINYDGNRSAEDIARCVRARDCTGRPQTISPVMVVPHANAMRMSSSTDTQQASASSISVCKDHPSWIVFSMPSCPACVRAKSTMDELQKKYPGHVQQFNVNQHEGKFDALNLRTVPAFIYIDPQTDRICKVDTANVLIDNDPSVWPEWAVRDGIIRKVNCSHHTMTADCPAMMMTADCPVMDVEHKTMMMQDATTSMTQRMWQESSSNPQAMAQIMTQQLKDALCTSLVLEVCRACPAFFVFTGLNWCTECQMFVAELIKLKQMAACGMFHVSHFDTQVAKDDFNKRVCNAFQIAKYPTVLVFDPRTFSVTTYTGLLQAEIMASFITNTNKRNVPQIAIPRDISFHVTAPSTQQITPRYEKRLCAHCPSILIFAVHKEKYADVLKANGKEFHVELFDVSIAEQRKVFEAFKINTLPKVLIYNPSMGNFYVFEGHSKDVPKTAAQAYKHSNGRVWNDYPRIVLQHS